MGNFALNRKRLVRELMVPGSIDDSKLLQRVIKGELPPDGDKLTKAEIETLKKWIEADAPAFSTEAKRAFVSPMDMRATMLKDLEKATDRDRPLYRYFTLTHLYNAGFEDNELESHRQELSKLVNSLSWGREVRVPVPVDPTKTILRIDLRHYKWNENEAWSRMIAADPYRMTYSDKAAKSCYEMTKCELPHVRADGLVRLLGLATAALQPDPRSARDSRADAGVREAAARRQRGSGSGRLQRRAASRVLSLGRVEEQPADRTACVVLRRVLEQLRLQTGRSEAAGSAAEFEGQSHRSGRSPRVSARRG